jgi:hypothetical protein
MTPTAKLRFVERDAHISNPQGFGMIAKTIIVLQQWWGTDDATDNEIRLELNGEWRDVPLEKEQ